MIPKNLNEWDFRTIEELINKKVNESERHDFKKNMPDSKTLTKICCAFANTEGGFIVFGVEENGSSFKINGIENNIDLAHKFGQKVKANPTIDYSLPKIIKIPNSAKVLAVFEIPLSYERPHIPDHSPEKRLFYKRTNRGNDYMSYEEIRLSFQNYQERREKIKLLYIELCSNINRLNAMKVGDEMDDNAYSLMTLDSTIITGLISELYSIISNDIELVNTLLKIRERTEVINNKIKIFYSTIAVPRSNGYEIIKRHNDFINKKVDLLKPLIEKALSILESRYDFKSVKNP